MSENISRLMDGEVDEQEFARICADLKSPDAMNAWVCYHVIGDSMRGTRDVSPRLTKRVCAALAAEPTMLSPGAQRGRKAQVATAAWAVAASIAAVTVVGWTAFSMVDSPPTAVARARDAATVRAAQLKAPAELPADYLIAHQEYSPSTAIQGMGPYLRAVAVTGNEPRP